MPVAAGYRAGGNELKSPPAFSLQCCILDEGNEGTNGRVRRPGLPGERPRAGHRCLSPVRFRASLPHGRLARNHQQAAAVSLQSSGGDKRDGQTSPSRREPDRIRSLTGPTLAEPYVSPRVAGLKSALQLQFSLRLVRLPSGSLLEPTPRQGSLSEAPCLRFLGEPPEVGSRAIPPGLRLLAPLPAASRVSASGERLRYGGLAFPERGPGPDTGASLRADSVVTLTRPAGIAGWRPPFNYSPAGDRER